jgi:hypothetical protein
VEVSEQKITNELLKDVNTKWLISNLRNRESLELFAGGYLFGVTDILYGEGI